MADKIPGFLRQDGNRLYFNMKDKELIYYIPEDYFSSKMVVVDGAFISLLGVFEYAIVDSKTGKQELVKNFRYPSIFVCKPYTIERKKAFKPTKNSKEDDYRLIKFKYGDIVIDSIMTPESIDNVEEFFKMFFITAKIPNSVSYEYLWEYIEDNFNQNGGSYGIHSTLLGIMAAECCTSPSDPRVLYRHTDMKDPHGYQLISIKSKPKYISPYVAITSENFDESLIASVLMKDTPDNKIKTSPMERIVMQ